MLFRSFGKQNTNELNPLQGIPGQNMDKSITSILALFDKYKEIEIYKERVVEEKKKLQAYKDARKYNFISDLVGGKTKYEENLVTIRSKELELSTLVEEAVQGRSEEDIAKNKKKVELRNKKFNLEQDIQSKEMRLQLVNMSLEYGLYPTEADMTALQEYFPGVNLRKLYEVEQYHKKIAQILDAQFEVERDAIEKAISELKE